MLILGLDTATLSCSTALLRGEIVLAETTLNIRKTHSERLMPQLDRMLTESGVEREELAAVAVSAGPGSFTGLRIGVATARGLAQGLNIPAVPVCTLEALAEAVVTPGTLVCPLLDARRSQVYTALYRCRSSPSQGLEILLDPVAETVEALIDFLGEYREPVVFLGEGAAVYGDLLKRALPARAVIAPAPFRLCRASLVALRGQSLLRERPHSSYRELIPRYVRVPEAERLAGKQMLKREAEE